MVIILTKLSTLQTKAVFHFGVHFDGKQSFLSQDCSNLALNINPGYFWNTGECCEILAFSLPVFYLSSS